ncbi:SMI1/KNR4 family protein [Leptothoe sp. PORK10 BA2]|uniref:SMI1/KNR4 family protein n=1 Tax=Leptothoe sp. PORK10 BA2 TaxID=3110254 RepID=UPI002B1F8DE7|nr:SMI1/KNR4 family protein [Leptothoe sp. PORK10 BA2]MEA5465228.1 SMI1/KNR4 family protein [Leptothoe sp. PORK10 BA2]
MQEIWERIENWLRVNAPQVFEVLQPGASDAQIAELENFLSIQFPEDIKTSYRIHDGQSTFDYGLINGRELLSLERIRSEWQVWKELLDSGTFQNKDGQDQGSEPAPGICNVWWSSKWIPLTYDGAGNHDCLDLIPATGGTNGQIISMWHDDAERNIVAPSFCKWLEQYAEGLESGQFVFSEEYNGIMNRTDLW